MLKSMVVLKVNHDLHFYKPFNCRITLDSDSRGLEVTKLYSKNTFTPLPYRHHKGGIIIQRFLLKQPPNKKER